MNNLLTRWLARRLLSKADSVMESRPCDFVINSPQRDYLYSWYFIRRNWIANAYIHHIVNDDDDRACHDHPWLSVSIVLTDNLSEYRLIDGVQFSRDFKAGDVVFRSAKAAHRLYLRSGTAKTFFFTGPKIRTWGFLCPQGWRSHDDFAEVTENSSSVGRGCD